jgi:hypothetical protein
MKKNFLRQGKLLKDTLTTIRDNIWNNLDNFKCGDRREGFKTTYAGAEWHIKTMYYICDEVLDCFLTYDESYATQVKNAFLLLGECWHDLAEYSQNALEDLQNYYFTNIAPDYDEEPTYENFMDNIGDCEYTYEYEDWDQTEAAIYWLEEEIGYQLINYAFDMYTHRKEAA